MGSQRCFTVYFQILYQMFKDLGDELDEERIIKSATGIRNTVVWKKLFHFQRDGVTGAIDKLERIGGCIIADSIGLGKTFEALAVIKYYELRNDRVLVLCPKRLRDNCTLDKTNDRRNVLAPDRLNYDVLITRICRATAVFRGILTLARQLGAITTSSSSTSSDNFEISRRIRTAIAATTIS